ncbi:MAG TPA: S-methyl-5-thioribose kinase [Ancylobacter sp.]
MDGAFLALTPETLPARLGSLDELTGRIGADAGKWKVSEVGDGNLNLVFVVTGDRDAVIVKQALPYVRLVGEKWPLPLKRSFFEFHALTRQASRAPGMLPEVFYFDEAQALIVMEYLTPHVILRKAFIAGEQPPNAARDLGTFMARTLFLSSDLHMNARQRKMDLALFADNAELCDITENLVFSDPYYAAELNAHTSPQLDGLVAELRADVELKVEAQKLKQMFVTRAEALLHGDLHTGSVMVTADDTRVIDPEFAFYGPMAFDVGMLIANFWMAYFSQDGRDIGAEKRDQMRRYLLQSIEDIWRVFVGEFSMLWSSERKGILYQQCVLANGDDNAASEKALADLLRQLLSDALGFAGVEIHRRILGLAHNADFETIEDRDMRATCEARALRFGRAIILDRSRFGHLQEVNRLAAEFQNKVSS